MTAIWYPVLAVLAAVLVLAAICLARACAMRAKPNKPAPVAPPQYTPEQLDRYGESMAQMVRVPTIFRKGEDNTALFERYFEVLAQRFPRVMQKLERIPVENAFLLRWKGSDPTREPLMLMSHADVVEAPGRWEHPPFDGEIEGDVIWGRGTIDTKNTMCALLHAVDELIEEGFCPKQDLYLASSWCEEVGGDGAPNIARYFRENGIHLELSIDEGGNLLSAPYPSMQGVFGMIRTMEKGYADFRFVARSQGGHAMMGPPNTPLVRLARLMDDLDRHSPFPRRLSPGIAQLFLAAAPYMSLYYRFFFANGWLLRGLWPAVIRRMGPEYDAMLRTTCAFTMASGSGAPNVIPSEASVVANCRFVHHQTGEEVLRLLRQRAARYDIEVEVLRMNEATPPCEIESGPFAFIRDCINEVFAPDGVLPSIVLGGTDARHMVEVATASLRFTAFEPVAKQKSTAHGNNEFILKRQLGDLVCFDKHLIRQFNA